jgi:hypothetical protein
MGKDNFKTRESKKNPELSFEKSMDLLAVGVNPEGKDDKKREEEEHCD